MPRHARLDFPGAYQHVIARGVGRARIFCDTRDRREFLKRLGKEVKRAGARCYAWALLPNHVHILLRTGNKPLQQVMQRILTGYAVYHNLRHERAGHLFQNRYRSIVCQEDRYFMELVRYIHLNPVRAGVVDGVDDLERYPWMGHCVVMGHAVIS